MRRVSFKAMVGASKGEALADDAQYGEATADAPSDSVATVYSDVGGLLEESGDAVDPEAKNFLDAIGGVSREGEFP